MTKEQLIKEFREKFVVEADDVFIVVANEDELKELEAFLLSAFDAGEKNGIVIGRASGIEQGKDIVDKDLNKYINHTKKRTIKWANTVLKVGCSQQDAYYAGQVLKLAELSDIFSSLTPSSSKDN